MTMSKYIPLIGLAYFSIACSQAEESNGDGNVESDIVQLIDPDEAANLMINNCYACHNPKSAEIAPTLKEVRSNYLANNDSEDSFVQTMSSFINSPTKESAVMIDAVDKFGIMPNMQYTKEDVSLIVNYMYDTDIETDKWLEKYYSDGMQEPTFEEGDYLGLGRHIVMSTKKQLGKNLKNAIKTKGTKEAVGFCNANAFLIVDSMATTFNANIVRISDKNRNENNLANRQESAYILKYQNQLDKKEELKPILVETDDLATFYMPIVTNDMCLQCHGSGDDIESDVLSQIQKLYPKDKAIGYGINQIRGIWRVEIKK